MHLWTDYEGKTIAGDYPLSKLLRSEGRNAFFAARNPKGSAAVVRLTEAHFDESEMLGRWRKVVDLNQSSLLEIEKFGQTTVDGVTLAYAVLEPNDANLADVLRERPLTAAEATQVARNVAGALEALHSSGLVHEHVDAANVLAVGEDVKLRSDCVRECVADMEFASAEDCAQIKRKDVRDLGTLLLRCLTLEKTWNPTTRLPQPFAQIVPHALDGSWTLPQILGALEQTTAVQQQGSAAPANSKEGRPLVPEQVLATKAPVVERSRKAPAPNSSKPLSSAGEHESAPRLQSRTFAPPAETATVRPRSVWALAVAAIAIVLLGWFFVFHHAASHGTQADATTATSAPARVVAPAPVAAAPALAKPSASAPLVQSGAFAPGESRTEAGWRVIAYTYHHEGQAQAQAQRLNQRHPGLHAQVFSQGHGTYLVALSGPVSESDAKAILHRVRREGAPRDTFIRRY